uniref:ATP synthase complex subunit 8 n=1 Tax=Trigonopterus tanimbarensis TaxID=2678946 RepID=A0A7H1KHR7_9CUCU|nr:ATP synthase F0 subunit 8 [Trigonopterus tanimbarensis]QNT26833.1 ATP synthase F0 subunit 8 [Trigonopterus tanimbarensis]
MPQMAPMNWTMLYMFMILLFMLVLLINYSTIIYQPLSAKTKYVNNKPNWKW